MTAYLHLDDDLANRLAEQARREQTTLDIVLNRVLRRSVQPEPPPQKNAVNDEEDRKAWLEELRVLREQCSTGKPGIPLEQLIDEIRS